MFGFLFGDVTRKGIFAFLWSTLPGLGRQSNDPIFWLKVFRKLDYHPTLDWLSSISGAKIMAKKTKIGKKFLPLQPPTWGA